MVSHFMLVSSQVSVEVSGRFTAFEVLTKRLGEQRWPLYQGTRYKGRIKEGDKLVFYLSGTDKDSQTFVATATAASQLEELPATDPESWDVPRSNLGIRLSDVKYLDKHVPIRNILSELSFIKRDHKWGAYIQGGCAAMTKEDYDLILKLGN